MKKLIGTIFAITLLLSSVSADAWLFYSKPEFRGRVIDAETKQPIEGAVVVALYYKRSIVSINPGGASSYIFNAKETLTNSKGEFYLPSYFSLIIFTEDTGVGFIFFKPGYMAISDRGFDTGIAEARIGLEKYLATDVIGKEAEFEVYSYKEHKYFKWKCNKGIVELKKAKTREERIKTRPSSGGLKSDQLPIFFNILDGEYNYLYQQR